MITIEDRQYSLAPLTKRQFKEVQADKENTIDRALSFALPAETVLELEDLPFYISKQLFDEVIDLTIGGKAEKNSPA